MRLFEDGCYWVKVRDGNLKALAIYERHYSRYEYADGRKQKLFVGPGEKLVLLGKNDDALFVWRKFIDDSGQTGVNCAAFRNETEGKQLSSELILQAEEIAVKRWGNIRFYTHVDPEEVKSTNPERCFKAAGWRVCGETQKKKLIILEKVT